MVREEQYRKGLYNQTTIADKVKLNNKHNEKIVFIILDKFANCELAYLTANEAVSDHKVVTAFLYPTQKTPREVRIPHGEFYCLSYYDLIITNFKGYFYISTSRVRIRTNLVGFCYELLSFFKRHVRDIYL